MKRLHVVGDRNPGNGMFVAARLMAAHEEGSRVVTCAEFLTAECAECEEVVVHGCWLPRYWRCCRKVLRLRKGVGNGCRCTKDGANSTVHLQPSPFLARMTHANLDPVRLAYHGWKKRLVAPIERWLFRKCDKILVTCPEEAEWVSSWLGRARISPARSELRNRRRVAGSPLRAGSKIEIVDLKRFFHLNAVGDGTPPLPRKDRPLHVLYLGRRHPLKGVAYLEQAVQAINQLHSSTSTPNSNSMELRIVSDHGGEELERDWEWCDVLCLPTLSENFGLVIAEALERGRSVIATDGAPAWAPPKAEAGGGRLNLEQWRSRLNYLKGFRDGTDAQRVQLLKDAFKEAAGG